MTVPTVTGEAFDDGLSAVVGVLLTTTWPLDDPDADDNEGEPARCDIALILQVPKSCERGMMDP